jgi:hypothetical protein
VLTIKLRRTARSVRITMVAPSLRARSGQVADSTFGHGRQVVTVSVVDAAARRTRLSEKVAVTR